MDDREPREIQLDTNKRVEDGPIRFVQANGYKDWTGAFIRGDSAAYYSFELHQLIEALCGMEDPPPYNMFALHGLLCALKCSYEGGSHPLDEEEG